MLSDKHDRSKTGTGTRAVRPGVQRLLLDCEHGKRKLQDAKKPTGCNSWQVEGCLSPRATETTYEDVPEVVALSHNFATPPSEACPLHSKQNRRHDFIRRLSKKCVLQSPSSAQSSKVMTVVLKCAEPPSGLGSPCLNGGGPTTRDFVGGSIRAWPDSEVG